MRAASLARERFLTTLLLLFAGVGLALAVVGVYGVMAQMARRRVREMGIRLALGAQANDVRWLVVRNGLRLVAVGLVIGTAGAFVATRTMQALLFGVAPKDPLTFLAVPAVLVLTALTWRRGCRRRTRVAPIRRRHYGRSNARSSASVCLDERRHRGVLTASSLEVVANVALESQLELQTHDVADQAARVVVRQRRTDALEEHGDVAVICR